MHLDRLDVWGAVSRRLESFCRSQIPYNRPSSISAQADKLRVTSSNLWFKFNRYLYQLTVSSVVHSGVLRCLNLVEAIGNRGCFSPVPIGSFAQDFPDHAFRHLVTVATRTLKEILGQQ